MKLIPKRFSTQEVQAILDNRKTQFREVIKPQPKTLDHHLISNKFYDENGRELKCKYQPGHILWVKETWAEVLYPQNGELSHYAYKADEDFFQQHNKWKSPIHMPKDACRLFLEVVSVRAERLWDISEQDAIAEGVGQCDGAFKYFNLLLPDTYFAKAKYAFQSLWQSINGPDSWGDKFVFAVEFKRIDKPEGFTS